jgi:hypothetical protein
MSIHISAFSDEIIKHGGVRRSEQITTLAASKGYVSISPPSLRECTRLMRSRPLLFFKALFLTLSLGVSVFSLKGFRRSLSYGAWLIQQLHKEPEVPIWIEIGPNRNILLAALIMAMDRPYVAFPHNVEFLVPHQSQKLFRGSCSVFKLERAIYLKASSVIAISNFDAAVIRSLGVKHVETMRYDPVGSHRDKLLKIHSRRNSSKKSRFLILGSATNPPTRAGIQKILDEIVTLETNSEYVLAGYGTESFKYNAPISVSVLGSVSDETLSELLSSCEALIVHQPQTSGMLTRLIDAEVAGVPVWILGDYLQASDPLLHMTKYLGSLKDLPI